MDPLRQTDSQYQHHVESFTEEQIHTHNFHQKSTSHIGPYKPRLSGKNPFNAISGTKNKPNFIPLQEVSHPKGKLLNQSEKFIENKLKFQQLSTINEQHPTLNTKRTVKFSPKVGAPINRLSGSNKEFPLQSFVREGDISFKPSGGVYRTHSGILSNIKHPPISTQFQLDFEKAFESGIPIGQRAKPFQERKSRPKVIRGKNFSSEQRAEIINACDEHGRNSKPSYGRINLIGASGSLIGAAASAFISANSYVPEPSQYPQGSTPQLAGLTDDQIAQKKQEAEQKKAADSQKTNNIVNTVASIGEGILTAALLL